MTTGQRIVEAHRAVGEGEEPLDGAEGAIVVPHPDVADRGSEGGLREGDRDRVVGLDTVTLAPSEQAPSTSAKAALGTTTPRMSGPVSRRWLAYREGMPSSVKTRETAPWLGSQHNARGAAKTMGDFSVAFVDLWVEERSAAGHQTGNSF